MPGLARRGHRILSGYRILAYISYFFKTLQNSGDGNNLYDGLISQDLDILQEPTIYQMKALI